MNEILFSYVRFTHTQYYDISYKVENMSLWGPDPPPAPLFFIVDQITQVTELHVTFYKNYFKESLTYRASGYEKYFHKFVESHLIL